MKINLFIGFALIVFLFVNCARTEAMLRPTHKMAVTYTVLSKKQSLKIENVTFPSFSGVSGIKKGKYGLEDKSEIIKVDPKAEVLLQDALTVELTQAGFDMNAAKADTKMNVLINKYFVEPEVGFFAGDIYAVVDAEITIQLANKKTYKRRFKGIAYETRLDYSEDNWFIESLNNAMKDFLKKAMPAIIELVEGNAKLAVGEIK